MARPTRGLWVDFLHGFFESHVVLVLLTGLRNDYLKHRLPGWLLWFLSLALVKFLCKSASANAIEGIEYRTQGTEEWTGWTRRGGAGRSGKKTGDRELRGRPDDGAGDDKVIAIIHLSLMGTGLAGIDGALTNG